MVKTKERRYKHLTKEQRQEITALLDKLTLPQLEMAVKFLEAVNGGVDIDEAARLAGITA